MNTDEKISIMGDNGESVFRMMLIQRLDKLIEAIERIYHKSNQKGAGMADDKEKALHEEIKAIFPADNEEVWAWLKSQFWFEPMLKMDDKH